MGLSRRQAGDWLLFAFLLILSLFHSLVITSHTFILIKETGPNDKKEIA